MAQRAGWLASWPRIKKINYVMPASSKSPATGRLRQRERTAPPNACMHTCIVSHGQDQWTGLGAWSLPMIAIAHLHCGAAHRTSQHRICCLRSFFSVPCTFCCPAAALHLLVCGLEPAHRIREGGAVPHRVSGPGCGVRRGKQSNSLAGARPECSMPALHCLVLPCPAMPCWGRSESCLSSSVRGLSFACVSSRQHQESEEALLLLLLPCCYKSLSASWCPSLPHSSTPQHLHN